MKTNDEWKHVGEEKMFQCWAEFLDLVESLEEAGPEDYDRLNKFFNDLFGCDGDLWAEIEKSMTFFKKHKIQKNEKKHRSKSWFKKKIKKHESKSTPFCTFKKAQKQKHAFLQKWKACILKRTKSKSKWGIPLPPILCQYRLY